MKALILNFTSFNNKDKSKLFYKFDFWDVDGKSLYNVFVDSQYCLIPNDGVVPTKEECLKNFPAMADLDFVIEQYRDSEGKQRYSPRVRSINSWKRYDFK